MTPEELADDIFEYDAPGERTKGTFTVTTEQGEDVEITEKYAAGNGITVFRSVDGADYVATNRNTVVRYDPEIHDGGVPATGEAGAMTGDSADATDAAEIRKALDEAVMEDGVDATDAAEATVAVEESIAPSPTAIPPPPPPPPTDEPEAVPPPPPSEDSPPPADGPEATDLAEEQPEGSDLKEGPPEEES